MRMIRKYRNKASLIVLSILILALAIRLYHLNKYDLWFDEISSYVFSHQTIESDAAIAGVPAHVFIFNKCRNDPLSFFYYLLIYLFSFLLQGWRSLRLLSVIFGFLSLLVFYRLARRIYDRSTGRIALFLMAVSPFQVWYAQEMRAYVVAEFFSLLAVLFFVKLLEGGKKSYWFYFFISGMFAILMSYYSALLVMIMLAYLYSRRDLRYARRGYLFIAALVFFAPLFGLFLHQLYAAKNLSWMVIPHLRWLVMSFAVFGLGYSSNIPQFLVGYLLLASLFTYGVHKSFKQHNAYASFMLFSFFLPVIIIFLFSRLFFPVYIDRQFIVITPFYYLFIAKGLSGIKNIRVKAAVLALLTVLMSTLLVNYYKGFMMRSKNGREIYFGVHERKQYGGLISYLKSRLQERDIIAATDIQSYFFTIEAVPAGSKDKGIRRLFFYPKYLQGLDRNALFGRFLPPGKISKINDGEDNDSMHEFYHKDSYLAVNGNPLADPEIKRIWLVSSFWDSCGSNPVNNNYGRIEKEMLRYYKRDEFLEHDGVILERFSRR